MAFRLESPDDLELFEDKLERNEYRVQRVSMGDEHALGEAIRFTAPSEHRVELYYDMRLVGNGLPLTNPDPYPGRAGGHPPAADGPHAADDTRRRRPRSTSGTRSWASA